MDYGQQLGCPAGDGTIPKGRHTPPQGCFFLLSFAAEERAKIAEKVPKCKNTQRKNS